jgi:hypothetical protein
MPSLKRAVEKRGVGPSLGDRSCEARRLACASPCASLAQQTAGTYPLAARAARREHSRSQCFIPSQDVALCRRGIVECATRHGTELARPRPTARRSVTVRNLSESASTTSPTRGFHGGIEEQGRSRHRRRNWDWKGNLPRNRPVPSIHYSWRRGPAATHTSTPRSSQWGESASPMKSLIPSSGCYPTKPGT